MMCVCVCACVTVICGCVGGGVGGVCGGARAAQTGNVQCCVNAMGKKTGLSVSGQRVLGRICRSSVLLRSSLSTLQHLLSSRRGEMGAVKGSADKENSNPRLNLVLLDLFSE